MFDGPKKSRKQSHRSPIRRRRQRTGRILLVNVSVLFALLVIEVGLRVADYSYQDFYMPHETRGYTLRPGVEGWYGNEGGAYVRINSDGLRDFDHTKAKPANTVRIAVIGDSYAEALYVSQEQAFWSVMEKRLQEADVFQGKKIEVLNFGVGGYGTAQELLIWREKVLDYSPDIVMLAFYNNDVIDDHIELRQRIVSPYFVFRDGSLQYDGSFRNSKAFRFQVSALGRAGAWIYRHSRVVQIATLGFRGLRIWLKSWSTRGGHNTLQNAPAANDRAENRLITSELGTDVAIYVEPTNAVWNDAWQVTEELVATMSREVRATGARLLVVSLSAGPQVHPDPRAREAFMQRYGIVDLFYPDNRIKSLCSREGIPVITLAPALQKYAETNRVFLHGFGGNIGNGHWNIEGNRVAGELIAREIYERRIFQPAN